MPINIRGDMATWAACHAVRSCDLFVQRKVSDMQDVVVDAIALRVTIPVSEGVKDFLLYEQIFLLHQHSYS